MSNQPEPTIEDFIEEIFEGLQQDTTLLKGLIVIPVYGQDDQAQVNLSSFGLSLPEVSFFTEVARANLIANLNQESGRRQ